MHLESVSYVIEGYISVNVGVNPLKFKLTKPFFDT